MFDLAPVIQSPISGGKIQVGQVPYVLTYPSFQLSYPCILCGPTVAAPRALVYAAILVHGS